MIDNWEEPGNEAGYYNSEVVYDHTSIRNHLAKCLEDCKFSRFPVLHGREGNRVKYVQHIELHCVCHLPEEGDMAECEPCGKWFHRHCVDIPDAVFDTKNLLSHSGGEESIVRAGI